MSANYKKAMLVLQKWTPLPPGREFMDFSIYLRQMMLKSFPSRDMFPGNQEENFKKLNSLMRVAENKCGKQYNPLKVGALGFEKEDFALVFKKENFEKLVTIAKPTE